MNHQTKKRSTLEQSTNSNSVHLVTTNNAHFSTLSDWYVSTTLQEEQLSDLEDLLNKHGDKIGLSPDLRYLGGLDKETYDLLKRIEGACNEND